MIGHKEKDLVNAPVQKTDTGVNVADDILVTIKVRLKGSKTLLMVSLKVQRAHSNATSTYHNANLSFAYGQVFFVVDEHPFQCHPALS